MTILLLISALPLSAEEMLIDLPATLRLADQRNTELALQVEKLNHAELDVDAAVYQWIPTLRLGHSYAWQDGALQNTNGTVANVERNARYTGLGAGAVGAGLTSRPGLSLNLNLAKAFYEPLAAKQKRLVVTAASQAVRLDVTLAVTEAYYDLVRAVRAQVLAKEATAHARQLADVTVDFAESGEGLPADAERANVEMLLQEQSTELATERIETAAVKLAWLLHLDNVQLRPAEQVIRPLKLVKPDLPLKTFVDKALVQRPEIKQSLAAIDAEKTQLDMEKYKPFIPNVEVGYSYGNFGGGRGTANLFDDDRRELYGMLYWQWDHLGFGNHVSKRRQRLRMMEAKIYERKFRSDVVAEVKTAYYQFTGSGRRLAIAKQTINSARRAFVLNNERIHENQGLPLEALQSMKVLAEAETLYLDIAAKYNLAQFRLQAATGQIEARENGGPLKAADATAQ
jgi:outer membrane protein TolC